MTAIPQSLMRVVRFALTPHNPRNIAWWVFHKALNVRPVIFLYRNILLTKNVARISKKSKIRVVFLPMNLAMWRYDDVYKRMKDDPRFEPIIITAPRITQAQEFYVREQHEMISYFASRGYSAIAGFNEQKQEWICLSAMSPDILFYTQPYDGLLPSCFEYWHNLNSLICYTPYSFQFAKVDWNWDNALQNYAWKHYISLPEHQTICRHFSRIKGRNTHPVGYFFEEDYKSALQHEDIINTIWRDDKRKRVIWAPHHSLNANAPFKTSSFLEIADVMLKLRDKYRDRIIFAFKPHPILRDNLYQCWGKTRTEVYYRKWAEGESSFCADSTFASLFAGSDAMIHCCGSFIVDYIYTCKPVQYVYCKDRNAPDFGETGAAALKAHYAAHNIEDIERFIREVVLGGDDPMKMQRYAVYQHYLQPPHSKSFSENVVNDILQSLNK